MTKHTQGPWTFEPGVEDREGFFDIWFDQGGCGATIAEYVGEEANARLIAAAPDLLAALEHSRQFVMTWRFEYADKPRTEHNDAQRYRIDSALAKIDAAIAKARGDV
jgi:hypothetical protein